MNIKRENLYKAIAVLALLLIGLVAGRVSAKPETVEVVKYVEVVNDETHKVDASIIENNWDGNFSDGNIRMISAWYYADGVIEDETGTLWATDFSIDVSDFLLIWIADNHTPENEKDDIIVKVWSEVYD